MKKRFLLLNTSFAAIVVKFPACKKGSNQDANFTTFENAKENAKSALTLSQSYNDALIMVNDKAYRHQNNRFCFRHSSLHHHSDSMFNMHCKLSGDEKYCNGVMMPDYTSGGMMNGGMMGIPRWRQDTAMMNGYLKTMQQVHLIHQPYHDGMLNLFTH